MNIVRVTRLDERIPLPVENPFEVTGASVKQVHMGFHEVFTGICLEIPQDCSLRIQANTFAPVYNLSWRFTEKNELVLLVHSPFSVEHITFKVWIVEESVKAVRFMEWKDGAHVVCKPEDKDA